MMDRRAFIGTTAVGVLVLSSRANAQRAKKLPRVAIVFVFTPAAEMAGADPVSPLARAFVHTLRDLGLVEGEAQRPAVRAAETFELVINGKTAEALGLTIPQSLLHRGAKVI